MPTTILDNESYPEALQRRYTEEAKNEENMKLIQMAEEACSPHQILNTDLVFLERFAALVAAHEREAFAKVCDELQKQAELVAKCFDATAEECAAAIRARSGKNV